MDRAIGIVGYAALSALGAERVAVWKAYQSPATAIRRHPVRPYFEAPAASVVEQNLRALRAENKYYRKVDRSVQLALLAARGAYQEAGWSRGASFGINLGSSRGATQTFEQYHDHFQNHPRSQTAPLTSPLTTLGNLSAWVGRDLGHRGPTISHSVTCSSALHALLNGIAWLRSGLAQRFLVGGSEAPLTPFTQAQMAALKITPAAQNTGAFPCRAMEAHKTQNGMVLGEGAAVFALEVDPPRPLAWIEGIGYGTEDFDHPTQISPNGLSLQRSMRMALADLPPEAIDLVVLHSPGTIQGDRAEREAIKAIFPQKIPTGTTNKWKIGHTLGASAALSLEFALLQMQAAQIIRPPYLVGPRIEQKTIRRVLLNAVGFGGNAASIIIRKPENSSS